MFDPSFPHSSWYYVRSCDVAALSGEVIDVMCDYGQRIISPITSVALWQMGGAVARVDDAATAFHGRKAGFTFNINGNSGGAEGFDAEREWARGFWSVLAPHQPRSMSTSSWPKGRSGSGRPTVPRSTTGSRRSSGRTTRATCSG